MCIIFYRAVIVTAHFTRAFDTLCTHIYYLSFKLRNINYVTLNLFCADTELTKHPSYLILFFKAANYFKITNEFLYKSKTSNDK